MRKRRMLRRPDCLRTVWLPALLILSVSFVLGALLGCFWTKGVSNAENSALTTYVEGYLLAVGNGELITPGVVSTLWDTLRCPILVFLLSFSAAGLLGIPAVFFIRGFLLSFAVSSFIRVLGGSGAILAFLVFGVSGMLSFPALFVLGTQGMTACFSLAVKLGKQKKGAPVYDQRYFVRCGFCFLLSICCACLELSVIPALMVVLAGTF